MRAFLYSITTPVLLAFIILITFGCSRESSPVSPSQVNPDSNLSRAEPGTMTGGELPLWMFDVTLNPDTLEYTMDPVISRQSGNIGDSFEVEISKFMTGYFQGVQCQDCLRIEKLGLYGNGDILMDVYMKHPFDNTSKRADLDVFDPRLILIVDGTDNWFTQTNGVGVTNEPIVGNFRFLKNADGYTSHFDNRAELPEFAGTPRGYRGNLNPYKYFFVDTDPDAVIYAKENPNHRMRMGRYHDVQRLRLANPGAGNSLQFMMAVEVSYVQSAKMNTRHSPIYHLPEGNQKEAYRIMTNMPRSIVEGDTTPLNFQVYVEDWQNSTPTGPLSDQVRAQSNVEQVTVEIPGVSSTLGTAVVPSAGSGIMYDPYVYNFTMPVDLNPVMNNSPYYALIAVEDELNDKLRADVYYVTQPLSDFVAYKVLPINVILTGTVPVINIYNYTVDAALGTCQISGDVQFLDQTSTITLTHNGASTYPISVDFDGTFTTTVVLFVGPNNIQIDATNAFGSAIPATIPAINYSPNPLPKFRVTLFWHPSTADPLDTTDMDLHLWQPASTELSTYHCFYDNRTAYNPGGTFQAVLNIDDPDGYGPENIDGKGVLDNGFYPVAVNYYSNHRGFISHPIDFSVRFLLNPGTVNESTATYNFQDSLGTALTIENFDAYTDYPVLDSTQSWMRVADIGVIGGVATLSTPDISRPLYY